MKNRLKSMLDDLLRVVYPEYCEVCGTPLVDGERLICLSCDLTMPRTMIHRQPTSDIHHRLAAPRLPIEKTASYFYYYRDSPYSEIIKRAKYNNRPELAKNLGKRFATELVKDNFFDGIDLLIPIPLHRMKQLRRGYNQSEEICRGISSVTSIAIADNLHARSHSTQTKKNASQRAANVSGLFHVTDAKELDGKHLLIVDDVITTGATMRNAVEAVNAASPTARLSVLSLGATRLY